MTQPQLIVLDVAGTVVRDRGEVPGAFTAALERYGLAVTPGELAAVRGASKREAIRRLVPEGPRQEEIAAAAYACFRELLIGRYLEQGVAPIEGAAETFEWFRARGVRVALNTGFDRDVTDALLRALQWDGGVVDAVACSDDVRRGRPAPDLIFQAMAATGTTDARRVASAGDTVLDLMAGARAGVRWNIGVLSGAHDRARLEQAPHTHLVPSVASLPDLWAAG